MYDAFLSYARKDEEKANVLVNELKALRPHLRLFVDQLQINPGAAWQQAIFEALDSCRRVITLFSPAYLASKICKEEFNIAHYRQRELEQQLVFPILLYTTSLPTYMRLVNHIDCREEDETKLRRACAKFIAER